MATISTVDNALDSLKKIPEDLANARDPLALKGSLHWGWHAVVFLLYHRLRPARDTFDQWFWAYLEGGEPALEIDRDAHWDERRRLSLLEILDMLSASDLSILKPEFYQGWQDRTTRCHTLRRRVAEVIGASLAEKPRQDLLLLLAAYHRLLRLPSPVDLEADQLLRALPALFDLLETLVDGEHDHSKALVEAIAAARRALPAG